VFHPGVPRARNYEAAIPFKTNPQLTSILLSDTLDRDVQWTYRKLPLQRKTFYSIPADSLYKVMMQASDNFIAEQLLLMCASKVSDSLKASIAIRYVKKNLLSDLADEPIWVDGSGLSRYNLFTPRSIVQLWDKIYSTVQRERLFNLLAIGGKSGTVRNWYKSDPPYIYGKTGTLSNNHCLSGYLVTKKGEVLIFSFMNSNFARPGNDVRKMMQETLKLIYEKY
jgi:serine-type D-Ala-D-Ala carboxypeptidase/endopeptidase (penicillin-binding protein 4)